MPRRPGRCWPASRCVADAPVVRDAGPDDVAGVWTGGGEAGPDDGAGIWRFGETPLRPHYTPLIGAEAADAQVRHWWNETAIGSAVSAGLVVVADAGGQVVGVGQRGRSGADHVVYKLYVAPDHRGAGLGPR